MDNKYVVFKTAEWEAWCASRFIVTDTDSTLYEMALPLEDAVIIRTQDVFAAAGLSAYAHNIRTQVALMRSALLPDLTDNYHALDATDYASADDMIDRLERIALYFEDMAGEAEDRIMRGECKVPD